MAKTRDLSSGWITYEVCEKDGDGNATTRPFSVALVAGSGTSPKPPVTKMRMVQTIGWPEAKRVLKDDHGHPLVVKKDDVIWLLKCKPHCWRLYFYVYESAKQKAIIYLLAICKKGDEEDPADVTEARRIYDDIGARRSAVIAFEFPTG
jgi:hypothetical protein